MVFGEKELYYLFIEIRDDLCFIRTMNAWSRYSYSVNLVARELCTNKLNSKTELTDEITKSLPYLHSKPSRPLKEDEINWYLFRKLAPYAQRVIDLIVYRGSIVKIMEVIIDATCNRDPSVISEHMKRAIKHFNNLHSIVDCLDFANVLTFKEEEIKLSLHSNDRLDELCL